jgi:hypothetical protein
MSTGLPYVDEHALRVEAPRELVWTALQRYTDSLLRSAEHNPLLTLLDPEPRAGFEVTESIEQRRLSLAGRHRFSRYRLVFELADAPGGATCLQAHSYAAFPGLHGRAYRALVIGTRLHVLATNHMLRAIRASTRTPDDDKKRAAHRALVDQVLNGKGRASREQRALAFSNHDLAPPLHSLIGKVATRAEQVTDADFAAAKASGFSEDQLFELVICAAVGQSARLYEAGLAALAEATFDERPDNAT